jgi:hypothetical protein
MIFIPSDTVERVRGDQEDGVPPDERRCTWIKTSGNRCRQRRSPDDPEANVCVFHLRVREERVLRWTLAADTPDIPVEQHLLMELRTSYVMVRAAELEMHDLGLSTDAFVLETEEREDREGGPGGGYVSVKRAQVLGAHPLVLTYLREREHHMHVIKTCIAAGLAARQIAAVERVVESVMLVATTLTEELGHDPTEPRTRALILTVLRRVEDVMAGGGGNAGGRALEA